MEKTVDILALGEILIDFTPAGKSASGEALFERNPGGAPANVAVAVSRLGGTAAFIGKVGKDSFGQYLTETLAVAGVETRGLRVSPDHHTTLSFVSLNEQGERDFSFCRNPGADCLLSPQELDLDLIRSSRVFHCGSLSLTHNDSRESTMAAMTEARKNGALISCDPNWRASLWADRGEGLRAMNELVSLATVLKVSDVELVLLSGLDESAAETLSLDTVAFLTEELRKKGPALVAVTLGARGVWFSFGEEAGLVPSFNAEVVDTTGAGDSFAGALLYRLTRREHLLEGLALDELIQDLRFSNAAASLCVGTRGAIPAMPSHEAVMAVLDK